MDLIGYARVSSKDQNLDRQLDALKKAGCLRIFEEKISGATTQRPELKRMLDFVREGDTLIVSSLDRLGRSAVDLLQIVDQLREKKVELESLKENLDTSTAQGRFTLQMFAAIAELERESIKERQREGLEAAKRRGVKLGRPALALPSGFERMVAMVRAGEMSKYAAAKALGMHYSSFCDTYKRLYSAVACDASSVAE